MKNQLTLRGPAPAARAGSTVDANAGGGRLRKGGSTGGTRVSMLSLAFSLSFPPFSLDGWRALVLSARIGEGSKSEGVK